MKSRSHLAATRHFLLTGAFAALCSASPAAPAGDTPAPASPVSNDLSLAYSFSPAGDLEHGGKIGEIKISNVRFNYLATTPLGHDRQLLLGAFDSFTDLKLTGTAALPDKLRQVGLTLGVRQSLAVWFGPDWSATALLRPNFAADSSGLSSAGFDLPVVLSLGYKQSPALSWDFGVSLNPKGRYTVLPLLAVRWDFAPDWAASLGFPLTGVTYKVSRNLTLRGGMQFQGGTYHIEKARAAGLGDTWMEYREIRAGVGFEYKLAPHIMCGLDAGMVVNRQFNYFDRDYRLDGGSTSYVSLNLRARF